MPWLAAAASYRGCMKKRYSLLGLIALSLALTGCYTVDDWNVYAAACKVLGIVPLIDPAVCPVPINHPQA